MLLLTFALVLQLVHADDCLRPQPRYEVREGKVDYVVPAMKEGDKDEVHNLHTPDYIDFSPFPPSRDCSEFVYARDKRNVYLNGKVVEGADPKGFLIDPVDDRFARDKQHAFWIGKTISEAVGLEFKAVNPRYAHDSKRAFFETLLIPEADAPSFEAAGRYFAQDKGRVFNQTESFPKSDFKSFGDYALVASKVYFREQRLKTADSKTFQALSDCFAKDATHVFSQSEELAGVTPAKIHSVDDKSLLGQACHDTDGKTCCAEDGETLYAFVRGKSSFELVKIPLKEAKVAAGGWLITAKAKYRSLVAK